MKWPMRRSGRRVRSCRGREQQVVVLHEHGGTGRSLLGERVGERRAVLLVGRPLPAKRLSKAGAVVVA
jgi:hypothetical protein